MFLTPLIHKNKKILPLLVGFLLIGCRTPDDQSYHEAKVEAVHDKQTHANLSPKTEWLASNYVAQEHFIGYCAQKGLAVSSGQQQNFSSTKKALEKRAQVRDKIITKIFTKFKDLENRFSISTPFESDKRLKFPRHCNLYSDHSKYSSLYEDLSKYELTKNKVFKQVFGDGMQINLIMRALETHLIEELFITGKWRKTLSISLPASIPVPPVYPTTYGGAIFPKEKYQTNLQNFPILGVRNKTSGRSKFAAQITDLIFEGGLPVSYDDEVKSFHYYTPEGRRFRGKYAFSDLVLEKVNTIALKILSDYSFQPSKDKGFFPTEYMASFENDAQHALLLAWGIYFDEFYSDDLSVISEFVLKKSRFQSFRDKIHNLQSNYLEDWIDESNSLIRSVCEDSYLVDSSSLLVMDALSGMPKEEEQEILPAICNQKTGHSQIIKTLKILQLSGELTAMGAGLVSAQSSGLFQPANIVAAVGAGSAAVSNLTQSYLLYNIGTLEELIFSDNWFETKNNRRKEAIFQGALGLLEAVYFGKVISSGRTTFAIKEAIGFVPKKKFIELEVLLNKKLLREFKKKTGKNTLFTPRYKLEQIVHRNPELRSLYQQLQKELLPVSTKLKSGKMGTAYFSPKIAIRFAIMMGIPITADLMAHYNQEMNPLSNPKFYANALSSFIGAIVSARVFDSSNFKKMIKSVGEATVSGVIATMFAQNFLSLMAEYQIETEKISFLILSSFSTAYVDRTVTTSIVNNLLSQNHFYLNLLAQTVNVYRGASIGSQARICFQEHQRGFFECYFQSYQDMGHGIDFDMPLPNLNPFAYAVNLQKTKQLVSEMRQTTNWLEANHPHLVHHQELDLINNVSKILNRQLRGKRALLNIE